MKQPENGAVRTSSDRAERVSEAKRRARHALQAESHASVPGEVASACAPAVGVIIGVLLFWVILIRSGPSQTTTRLLPAAALGLAFCAALIEGVSVRARLQHLERELQRERDEIRHSRDQERDEVRMLYEAKGFSDPLLTQVVDTLCADDERLLKVMMHEELGLATEQLQHPVVVGAVTGLMSLASAAAVVLPAIWLPAAWQSIGVPFAAAVWIVVLSWVRSRLTDQQVIDVAASWLISAAVVVGTAHFLIRLTTELG